MCRAEVQKKLRLIEAAAGDIVSSVVQPEDIVFG